MKIDIETIVRAEVGDVWDAWNNPEEIKRWNAASDDWHTTKSEVDLRKGGTFSSRMEAKDGSIGFDFSGTYTKIVPYELIEYELEDGRSVSVHFIVIDGAVRICQSFEAEGEMDPEQQRSGWQSILNRFTRYVQSR